MIDGDPRLARLRSSVVDAVDKTFGTRCVALYVYGSGVDGSFIPGFSDFDLAIFNHTRPTLDDTFALHRHLGQIELDPFAYLQVKYVDLGTTQGSVRARELRTDRWQPREGVRVRL